MEKLYSNIKENTLKTFIESSIANIQEHKYKKIEKLKSNKQKEKLSYRCYLLFLFLAISVLISMIYIDVKETIILSFPLIFLIISFLLWLSHEKHDEILNNNLKFIEEINNKTEKNSLIEKMQDSEKTREIYKKLLVNDEFIMYIKEKEKHETINLLEYELADYYIKKTQGIKETKELLEI